MPVTLSPSIDLGNVSLRWKQPYVSEGLNRKIAGILPRGIYRGLDLSTNGTDLTVSIVPDDVYGDHLAISESSDGFALTFRDMDSGTIDLDLSDPGLLSETVIVALLVEYAVGTDTTATFIAYTLAEYEALTDAERFGLVVLGTVDVPASGTIPAGDITPERRTVAWENSSVGTRSWSPVLRNGDFELGYDGLGGLNAENAIPFWENTSEADGNWAISSTTPNAGSLGLLLTCSNSASAITTSMVQPLRIPITAGQLVKLEIFVKALKVATGGTLSLKVNYYDGITETSTSQSLDISLGSTDSSYRQLGVLLAAPSGYSHLESVSIVTTALTFGTTGAAVRIDDVQAWVETPGIGTAPGDAAVLRQVHAKKYVIEDTDDTPIYIGTSPLLRSANGEDVVVDSVLGVFKPNLDLQGSLKNLGSDRIASEADAIVARVTAPVSVASNTQYTLMWESVPVGGKGVRWYCGTHGASSNSNNGMVVTVNAQWDGTNWTKDVNGVAAFATVFGTTLKDAGESGFQMYRQASATNTWTDSTGWNVALGGVVENSETNGSLLRSAGLALTPTLSTVDRISCDIVASPRANMFSFSNGDIVGSDTIDGLGHILRSGQHLEEDFNYDTLDSTVWDSSGTGTIHFDSVGTLDLRTGFLTNDEIVVNSKFFAFDPNGDLGFRAYVRFPEAADCQARLGFWLDNGTIGSDPYFGFELVSGGDLKMSYHDGTQHNIATGFTPNAATAYWVTWYWSASLGEIYWHIGTDASVSAGGMVGGTYGTTTPGAALTNDPARLYVYVTTLTAAIKKVYVDYIEGWSPTRGSIPF